MKSPSFLIFRSISRRFELLILTIGVSACILFSTSLSAITPVAGFYARYYNSSDELSYAFALSQEAAAADACAQIGGSLGEPGHRFPCVNSPYPDELVFVEFGGTSGCMYGDFGSRVTGGVCETIPDGLPNKNNGGGGDGGCVGNPCNPATGNKFQRESDFSTPSFEFARTYNSEIRLDVGLGPGWRHSFNRSLMVFDDFLIVVTGAGKGEAWIKNGGVWQGDTDSDVQISELATAFEVTKPNGAVETYDLTGKLQSIEEPNSSKTVYTYNAAGQVAFVDDNYGRRVTFFYDQGHLESVEDPAGNIYRYEYDLNDNLTDVIYPGTTPTNSTRRIYHYENQYFPHFLTGITDENGDRYATFAYDEAGKAKSTEHAETTNSVGQERFELEYEEGVE